MPVTVGETQLWADALELPEVLERTLHDQAGIDEAAEFLSASGTQRIVATGNGAAFYAAQALWLATLNALPASPSSLPEVVAVPAGILARGRFQFRPGDRLLAISTSGELRDLVEAIHLGVPPYVAITSTPTSTIGANAAAKAVVALVAQRAVTHTQAFCGNVATALAIWSRMSGDGDLATAIRELPERCSEALRVAEAFARSAVARVTEPRAALVFGSGPAWAAALEGALLLKEVAGVPAEGTETREGATSGMFGLAPGHLVVSVPTGPDELMAEAEETCRGTGAVVVRVPSGDLTDPRLVAITSFPATLALAIELGLKNGLDVDRPAWAGAYYAIARAT